MDKEEIKQEIERYNLMIKEIEKKGIDALHEIDRKRGVDWALKVLKDDKKYFEDKLKDG